MKKVIRADFPLSPSVKAWDIKKHLVSKKFGTNKSSYVFSQKIADLWNSWLKISVENTKSFCTFKM